MEKKAMPDKQGKTEMFVTVSPEDVDAFGRLRPSMFMHYSEICAAKDTVRAGFDQQVLAGRGYAWILARLHIRMSGTVPREGDRLICRTWYKDFDGIFFPRFYEMLDEDGKLLALAVGDWLILDREKREMVRNPKGLDKLPYTASCEDSPMPLTVAKVVIPKSLELEEAGEVKITENEIDIVGHTNNAFYMKWAVEALPDHIVSGHALQDATLNFQKETRLGDTVKIFRSLRETDRGYLCHISFVSGESQVFKAILSFE